MHEQPCAVLADKLGALLERLAVADTLWYHVGSRPPGEPFDLAKLGTGEGLHAMGEGVYFTDNLAAVRGYAEYSERPYLTVARLRPASIGKLQRFNQPGLPFGPLVEAVVPDPSQIQVLDTVPVSVSADDRALGLTHDEAKEALRQAVRRGAPASERRLYREAKASARVAGQPTGLRNYGRLLPFDASGLHRWWTTHPDQVEALLQERLDCRPSPAPGALKRLLRGVELFSGACGFHLAALQEGCHIGLGVELNETAVRTARSHGHRVLQGNAADIDAYDMELVWRPDILIGGPPCQPFSEMGSGQGRYDPRDGFPHALAAIEALGPRRVVLENVRGFVSKRYTAYREAILEDLREHFAHVGVWVLNAKDFGVPQDRVRVFVWGAETPLSPPAATHGPGTGRPYVGVRDVLPDLEAPAVHQRSQTAKSRDVSQPAPTVTTKGTLYTAKAPGLVFGKGMSLKVPEGAELADVAERRLRPDELALIQGFPGAYTFSGTLTEQYKQVGNAVPPPLGRAVIRAATEGLDARCLPPAEVLAALKRENPSALLYEPREVYDKALVGVTNAAPHAEGNLVAVYDLNKLKDANVDALLQQWGEDVSSPDEDLLEEAFQMASDHVWQNMADGSYYGPNGPHVLLMDDPVFDAEFDDAPRYGLE